MVQEHISDEALVGMVQSGDTKAKDILVKRYEDYINIIAGSYFLLGFELSDISQECMICLIKAIDSYEIGDVPFKSYATTCIKNRLSTLITQSTNSKNKALNQSVSIFELTNVGAAQNPYSTLHTQMLIDEIIEFVEECGSKLEQKVFKLFIQGFSYNEIAKQLSMDSKNVDKALYRLRKKIKDKYSRD